jgi:hypothetical protein
VFILSFEYKYSPGLLLPSRAFSYGQHTIKTNDLIQAIFSWLVKLGHKARGFVK